ncbi:unnamed protein product [Vitrella brassicaformis CCMP3155]|uniref:Uncharacterized protein n=2 Tax=Vitrella brassicaformis TaxID=1169539 RepID=A0A0G4F0Z2_VITBC|nr:unnamed protein product [Vitrella brassicaformis CCMP3155]|eukprot:CEM05291.1 unnamed protein product [Vitrella brassicaformis CCMP3155]
MGTIEAELGRIDRLVGVLNKQQDEEAAALEAPLGSKEEKHQGGEETSAENVPEMGVDENVEDAAFLDDLALVKALKTPAPISLTLPPHLPSGTYTLCIEDMSGGLISKLHSLNQQQQHQQQHQQHQQQQPRTDHISSSPRPSVSCDRLLTDRLTHKDAMRQQAPASPSIGGDITVKRERVPIPPPPTEETLVDDKQKDTAAAPAGVAEPPGPQYEEIESLTWAEGTFQCLKPLKVTVKVVEADGG